MTAPDREFWMSNKHLLEPLVSQVVGFPIEVYWAASAFTGVDTSDSYQIMPSVEAERNRNVFWCWHLDNNPQWFPNPLEASAAFIEAWKIWRAEGARVDE